jgi:hypothetical protein
VDRRKGHHDRPGRADHRARTSELREENQLFLSWAGTAAEHNQSELILRLNRLDRWIREVGFCSALLFLILLAVSVYHRLYSRPFPSRSSTSASRTKFPCRSTCFHLLKIPTFCSTLILRFDNPVPISFL